MEQDGVMTGTLTGDGLMVIPTKFLASEKQVLQSAYGDSVRLVMNRLAKEIGVSYGKLGKDEGLTPSESFHLLAEMGETAGWGGMGVDGEFEKWRNLVFTISNCAFCSAESLGADGRCDFMAGMTEGICKATYGRDFRCDLLESTTAPERKCVLTAKEVGQHERENWKTAVYFPWMIESQ